MIGLLYLALCFIVGWGITSFTFPKLDKLVETTYDNRNISFSPILFFLPVWYLIGTATMTWAVYLIALLCHRFEMPLLIGNSIVIPVALVFSILFLYHKIVKDSKNKIKFFNDDQKVLNIEFILLFAITLLANVLMWKTFIVQGDKLYIGASVFSDFSPHIGMIRSFSFGNNFPTTYSHFAGEDIRYHFLFQFLVGNLEFLGLRIDYAFNLPSIISFVSAFVLLYFMALKITGKIGAGILACVFFAFRSSKALFTFLAGLPKGTNIVQALIENIEFIGDTPHEDWGLWNLNVYCNQRHLAFGMAAIFFVIILFLPHLYQMMSVKMINPEFTNIKENKIKYSYRKALSAKVKEIFFTKEGWGVKDLRTSIFAGIILGSFSFFHGAAVIACLLVLFLTAILSKRRLELLITAVITVVLSMLQSKLFVHGAAISPRLLFGFIAEHKTFFGSLDYLIRLLGILPITLLIAFCMEKKVGRYLIMAFSMPLLFAFTVSLTVDVTVNHKYIMISCILLGIFAASLIIKLWERKELALRVASIILIILLTVTGIYDFTTVLRKNNMKHSIVLEMNHPLSDWIANNSNSEDIFLTSNYTVNQVVFGGAMLYQGWQYYAWSAGYDTDYRDIQVKRMYEADTREELEALVEQNQIRYIIVDWDSRNSEYYFVNEDNIKETYQCLYWEGEGENRLSIYDTKQIIK